ncbi:MAG TPA: outer membrane protein assembly factor BamD, partial [Flavobacteriaceae bacterium]|nr:outer membrane protein assembly factor BamD [Flavobacteriaceae bacterium]
LIRLEFDNAQEVNTIEAYQDFLNKFPVGELSEKAKFSIAEINFKEAKKTNSIEEYKKFIQKYPNSKLSKEASDLILKVSNW